MFASQALPELHQLLLAVAARLQLATDRQLQRSGHEQLATGIARHGAAERVAFEGDKIEPASTCLERGRQPGRPGADDDQIVRVGRAAGIAHFQLARDRGHGATAVINRRPNQRIAGDLAGEIKAGAPDRRQLGVERRKIMSLRAIPQSERDRADRAFFRAASVAHAAGALHDRRLAVDHRQNTPFGAGAHAGAATDAATSVHPGVLQSRLERAAFARLLPLPQDGTQPPPLVAPYHATSHRCRRTERSKNEGNRRHRGHRGAPPCAPSCAGGAPRPSAN